MLFWKNKIEENLTVDLAERYRGKETTYRFICNCYVTFQKGLKFDRNRGVDNSTFMVFSDLTLSNCLSIFFP